MALARFSWPDRKALERITTAGRPGSGREGRRLFVARELAYNHSFRRRNHSPAKRSPDAGLGKLAFPLITDVGLDTSYWNRKSFILVVAGRRQQMTTLMQDLRYAFRRWRQLEALLFS